MPIYKPSELRSFLASLDIFPSKRLSQNFLIDGNIVHKILDLAEISPHDPVLEIGPGPGALTESLLERQASVIAVEKDPILANALNRFDGSLEVHCKDILKTDLHAILKHPPYKALGNLPYQLTSPILGLLAPKRVLFSGLTVMVQDEVARRITAHPKSSDYGSLSIFLEYHAQPHYGFKVNRNCFYPVPNVDSAVVKLTLRKPPDVSDEQLFFTMVRQAFQQRRKMLRASLKPLYAADIVVEALKASGFADTARPEELSLDELIALFEKIRKTSGAF